MGRKTETLTTFRLKSGIENAGFLLAGRSIMAISVRISFKQKPWVVETVESLKVGVCQIRVTETKTDNLGRAREMLLAAAGEGCRLAVLPEMFNCPYDHRFFRPFGETFPGGPTLDMLRQTARETKMVVVGGTLPELDGELLYNTCFVFGPDGGLLGRYRKAHLFDVELETITFKESHTFSAGSELGLVATPLGLIGIAICFDIRFPVFIRALALQGARLLVLPAAFNTVTGPAHWELLLRARALDNQVYVIGASPARNEQAAYLAYGHSMVVDPWGSVLTRAGERETLLTVDLDPAFTDKVRAELPVLHNRRKDLVDIKIF
ncbi:carbon-nitrogen hydrolase family protein [Desulforudis sp. 1031]|uniref:carbon-nitrogen hydrolase family protein n=1 Tax=unclassified Candidatus Desulforudis TaxID=2635950 RepID=UPI003CE57815